MTDFVKQAKLAAENELKQERQEKAKDLIKKKLRQIADTETILANLKRELEDLEHEIEDGNL